MTNAVKDEVYFLAARLEELDFSSSREDLYRDFCGHVWPSVERLQALVGPPPALTEKCPNCFGTGKWRRGICRICDGKGTLVSEPVARIEFAQSDEPNPRVVAIAHAIAERGFGRPWDDFEPINAFDTDQSDLLQYAQAAVSVLGDEKE